MEKSRISVQTKVNADINKTWDYYTSPQHITEWNFASDDWHCPSATNDLQKGGKLVATMASKDGAISFDFEGIYDEVIQGKKLAMTLGDGRKVDVVFDSEGDGTKVTGTFDPESGNPEEMQRSGWQAILDNFKKYVDSN